MAKSTVEESDGKRKREEEREEVRRELVAVMAKFAVAELACSGGGAAPAALLDHRLRSGKQADRSIARAVLGSKQYPGRFHA